ncbi:MAG: hypothetical protein FJZ67_06885 [Bacteroidetes bacterium]|nr:hypothetical protein [Bacteroidota bacterium]
MSLKDIITIARNKEAKNIGLGPWNQGNYHEAISFLQAENLSDFESIRFYHLSPKDFRMLYSLA